MLWAFLYLASKTSVVVITWGSCTKALEKPPFKSHVAMLNVTKEGNDNDYYNNNNNI